MPATLENIAMLTDENPFVVEAILYHLVIYGYAAHTPHGHEATPYAYRKLRALHRMHKSRDRGATGRFIPRIPSRQ